MTSYTVVSGSVNLSRVMQYNSAGAITEKSDICATPGCFAYNTTQPHALASISGGSVNGVSNPTFAYDANGNMLSGAARTVAYTSFNMAQSISEGTTTIGLTYDTEHARIVQTAPEGTTTLPAS